MIRQVLDQKSLSLAGYHALELLWYGAWGQLNLLGLIREPEIAWSQTLMT